MNERELFLEAIQLGSPRERAEYLDEACGGDGALRARLDELLNGYEDVVSVLERSPQELLGLAADETGMSECDGDGESAISPAAQLTPFLEPSDQADSLGRLGHYELLEVVGHGGFGIVVKAFDKHLHRLVAIKILMPHLAKTSPPRKRFLREARAAARVRHEHVIEIHAVEEQPLPYLVMEYVAGPSLQELVDGHGPLEPSEVVRLGRQIALGLAAAHEQGLVHHDVKPSNILLEAGGESRVKLTDFGVARTVKEASLTQSGPLAGTPMFMAPEQLCCEAVDHRADLFSLGSVLYTMTVGHPPFRAANTFAVLKRVVEDDPRPISATMPDTPAGLQAVIACLHQKEPDARFATAREVAKALSGCLQGPVALPAHKPQRHRWRKFVAASVGLALLVGLSWGLAQVTALPGSARDRLTPPAASAHAQARFAAQPAIATKPLRAAVATGHADEESASTGPSKLTDAERWEHAVALMPAEDRLQAFVARLMKLNPECVDPKVSWVVEEDAAVLLRIDDCHNLVDLSPIRALSGLKELQLLGQEHLDLTPLKGLRLTRFDSNGNLIADLSPLSGMPLEWLGAWGYAGDDIEAARGMPLTGVNCGASDVQDLSPLEDAKLNYLCINRTRVRNLSPLAGMPLRTLEMANTQVTDLTPIAGLPLENLSLQGTPVTDYSLLANLPLKTLWLDYQPQLHAALLRSIPSLETVNGRPIAELLGGDGS